MYSGLVGALNGEARDGRDLFRNQHLVHGPRSLKLQGVALLVAAIYVTIPGENGQNFRAIAERGALADAGKYGGITSISANLTHGWTVEESAQKDLDTWLGHARESRLRARSATWVVLLRTTPTDLKCPYANERVKVCRMIP